MAPVPERSGPPVAEEDSFSTAATVNENTPLLQSEAASDHTLSDGSPAAAEELRDGRRQSGADEPSIGWKRAVCIIFSMWVLIFLQASNMSGMTIAQSIIAVDLDSYENAMWFTTSYLITTAACAPIVGRLSTIFSPGSMILVSSAFFAIGAIVASQAHSFGVFILGRVLIGLGGGGILTLSLILVLALTTKKRRGLFIGMTNAGFTIGLTSGSIIFGALIPYLGWRALFWGQAPLGLLAGLGVFFSMPHVKSRLGGSKDKTMAQKLANIDYPGAVALTFTIVLFLYGLSGTLQILPIILSLLNLLVFIGIEFYIASDPIIPIRVLVNRGVLLTCLAQLGFMAARWTVLFYGPVFVLAVRGLSPAIAGAVLLPTNAGFGSGGLIVGWLHVRRGGSFWLPCVISMFLFGLALFVLSFISNASSAAWQYVLVVFWNGFCTGALLNYTLAHLLHLAGPESHYMATSLLATFRGFAGSFGTAIGGGVFARTLRDSLTAGFEHLDGSDRLSDAREALITKLIGSPALVHGSDLLNEAERAVTVEGYEVALRFLYQSAAALCILVLVIQACTGWSSPGSKEEEEAIEQAMAEADETMEA